MAAFQSNLNNVQEETAPSVNGAIPPSHAVTGREFDLATSQPRQSAAFAASPAPTSRSGTNRPRPLSMPPQPFVPIAQPPHNDESSSKPRAQQRENTPHKPSRVTNRILGDYTLSKTIGAGSMGKVKLATHNVSGQKVRFNSFPNRLPSNTISKSLPLKSFPASTPHPLRSHPTAQVLPTETNPPG